MIQQTSLQAYEQVKINKSQQTILRVLRASKEPMTNALVGVILNWPINRITPRVLELRRKGMLKDAGVTTCPVTGGKAHAWKKA